MSTLVKLDILSDPICPWCFIGKTRLDRALEQRPNHPFVIEWHPFQLNPDFPPDGMDRKEYLELKFGGKDGAIKAYAPVVESAADAGLDIDFAAIQRTPNTLNAHRLIQWGKVEGRQTAVVSALFKSYFQEGRNIGDNEVLADIADSCGMDAAMILRLLQSDADVAEIRERDTAARQMGVSSVPTFIVASQHAVPGAQPAETWLKVIDEIMAQQEDAAE